MLQQYDPENKYRMNIRQALHWAFGIEHAQLELPDNRKLEDRASSGFGMEYVLLQRARLGGHIDTSIGTSYPHDDAETISSVLSTLPPDLGGAGMARATAILAKADMTPDWRDGDVPRIEPLEWSNKNQHGPRGKERVIGYWIERKRVPHPRNPLHAIIRNVRHEIRVVPITYVVHPNEIEAAHAEYQLWWKVLDFVRFKLRNDCQLTKVKLTDWMPPKAPWATVATLSVPSHPLASVSP